MAGLQRIAHHLMNNYSLTYCVIRHLKHSNVSLPKPLWAWTDIHYLCLCTDASTDIINRGRPTSESSQSAEDQTDVAMFNDKDFTGKIQKENEYSRQWRDVRSVGRFRNKDIKGSIKRKINRHDYREIGTRDDDQDNFSHSRRRYDKNYSNNKNSKPQNDEDAMSENYGGRSDSAGDHDNEDVEEYFRTRGVYSRHGKNHGMYRNRDKALKHEHPRSFVDDIAEDKAYHRSRGNALEVTQRRTFYKQDLESTGWRKERSHDVNYTSASDNVDDSDEFGSLSEDTTEQPFIDEDEEFQSNDADEDECPHLRLSKYNRRNPPYWYENKIRALGREGKVTECIEVFEEWMLKNDRVLPTSTCVSAYLGVLGRAGYTKKAFQIFNRMKKMKGVKLKDPSYTALFNACANSPWKEDGLKRARHLRGLMLSQDIEPNEKTTKAMIKAFGMLGDLPTVFILADDAASRRINMDSEFFSFMLMAAISDREAGFRYGLEVWKKMVQWRVKLDIYHYNLLVRLISECDVGNPDDLHLLLTPTANENTRKQSLKSLPKPRKTLLTENLSGIVTEAVSADETVISVVETKIPDILNPMETFSRVVSVREIKTAQDRFALIGGLEGLFGRMKKDGAHPDILTFTQLLKVIGDSTEDEERLLDFMTLYKIKPDVLFFNSLIHKRCMRHDPASARAVVPLMTEHKIIPDMKTYAGLALTCLKKEHGMQLISEIEDAGMTPNSVVFGSLLYASWLNLSYKKEILKCMKDLGVSPTPRSLQHIQKHLKLIEANGGNEKALSNFKLFYDNWLKSVMIEETDHPWKSFGPRTSNREPDKDRFKTKLEQEQRITRRMILKGIPMRERDEKKAKKRN